MDTATTAAAARSHRFQGKTGKLLINGEWVDAKSGKRFEVVNPATEEVICEVADGQAEDVDAAVMAARRAFESSDWRAMKPMQRERLMHKLADLLEANADEIAYLECIDNGKPMKVARNVDVPKAVERIRYCAGWASKLEGSTTSPSMGAANQEFFSYTTREPVGVCAQITPWNFPLTMAVAKVAPALAAGCTQVLKPAEQTPLSALVLGELICEAGFPPGVVNIITGFGETAGAPLVAHPQVDKIAFTGSTEVGKLIGQQAMKQMKRVSLELGGKSPVIIGPNADIDAAIKGAANGVFYNQGQVCVAGTRLYAAEEVFDEFVEGVAGVAKNLKMGNGLEEGVTQGPLVSKEQLDRVASFLDVGRKEGVTIHSGGNRVGDKGYFFQPTVLSNVDENSRLVREEIFGPVLVASPYKSIDDLADLANDTEYGLAASIWSRDISFCHKMARRIRAGTVWINMHGGLDTTLPFGGYKQSGVGRESGRSGVELYTEVKSVIVNLGQG